MTKPPLDVLVHVPRPERGGAGAKRSGEKANFQIIINIIITTMIRSQSLIYSVIT
jgi:hypothetical protein